MNKWLKGNGYWCPDCKGTGRGRLTDRFEYIGSGYSQWYAPCVRCGGEKRLAANLGDVIAGTVPQTPPPERHTCLSECIEYGRGPA